MVRNPVVSGQFYPDTAQAINAYIASCTVPQTHKIAAGGVIVPHAGHVYSWNVAAAALNKIVPRPTVVALGNNHTGSGKPYALWPQGSWNTPLGPVPINTELAQRILDNGRTITSDIQAHVREHSLEVVVPLMQYFFKQFDFVPIACSATGIEDYYSAAEQLFSSVRQCRQDVLFLASSDLTHYETDAAARKKDRSLIEYILRFDVEGMLEKSRLDSISLCGAAPVAIALLCCKKLGCTKAQVQRYQTSGDAFGDYSSVVGYAGITIQ